MNIRAVFCILFGIVMTLFGTVLLNYELGKALMWPIHLLDLFPASVGPQNPHNPFNLIPLLAFNVFCYGLLAYLVLGVRDWVVKVTARTARGD